MVNTAKLTDELRAALLPIAGVSLATTGGDANSIIFAECRLDFTRALTAPELTTAQGVVSAHNPTDNIAARIEAAATTFANIPNWALWTQADLQSWWDANLADALVDAFAIPAGVKTMLKAQNAAILREGKAILALRDRDPALARLLGL